MKKDRTRLEVAVLLTIGEHGKMTMQELLLSQRTFAKQLKNAVVQSKLLQGEKNGKGFHVSLTDQGKQLYADMTGRVANEE